MDTLWVAKDEEFVLAEGLDEAIIGVSHGPDGHRVVYDVEKCVGVLVDRDSMNRAEAREFLEYNTFHSWVGHNSPMFIYKYDRIIADA
jgi:hypothetical protein